MHITVTVPDELALQAQARGLTPQGYVERLIEDAVLAVPSSPKHVEKRRGMRQFLREMAAHSDKIPQLPDEAFTRESFYRDRD